MQKLLDALGKDIKKSGKHWVAKCPVHGDKDFAMSIKELPDGRILAYCHACGANGLQLYQALELPLDELMGGQENPNRISSKQREEMEQDKYFMAVYESSVGRGERPTYQDTRRYNLAKMRHKNLSMRL